MFVVWFGWVFVYVLYLNVLVMDLVCMFDIYWEVLGGCMLLLVVFVIVVGICDVVVWFVSGYQGFCVQVGDMLVVNVGSVEQVYVYICQVGGGLYWIDLCEMCIVYGMCDDVLCEFDVLYCCYGIVEFVVDMLFVDVVLWIVLLWLLVGVFVDDYDVVVVCDGWNVCMIMY